MEAEIAQQEAGQKDQLIIQAGNHSFWRRTANIIKFRELLFFFVQRDIKVRYKQTILGLSWAFLPPILSMLVFTIIFGRIAKMNTQGVPYPLFSFSAMVPWLYFSNSLSSASTSLVGNAMISKVYFPRVFVPLSPIFGNLVDLTIGLATTSLFLVYYHIQPGLSLAWLPLHILTLFLFVTGLSLIFSALAIQYRDIKFGIPLMLQLMMFGAPVVWSASEVPERFQSLYGLFPMVGIIEGVRACFLNTTMPWHFIWPGFCVALILFIFGFFFFHFREPQFADIF